MAANQRGDGLGKGLHMAHLNIRSLLGRGRADLIKNQIANSGYDVFTLSETWLTQAVPDAMLSVPNYSIVRQDRSWAGEGQKVPKKGGGVLCYMKESLKFSDSNVKELNTSTQDLEMQWLQLYLENVRPIVIVNVYRPPQGDYKKCCEMLTEAVNKAELADTTDLFVMGDFNIDMSNRDSPGTKELNFTMGSLGLELLVKEPTRTSFRNGQATNTCIDLIFSNSDFINRAGVLDLNLSDHLAVAVTRKKVTRPKGKVEFKGRSYRYYDREVFQDRLMTQNWDNYFEERDPNLLWEIMESIIMREVDLMCPMKSFKVSEKREPWITNEALEAIKDKDRILNRARRTGKQEDWDLARRERNRVGRDLEILRRDFLKQQQEEHKSDPKEFWKVVTSIVPNKKTKGGKIWLNKGDSKVEVEQEEVADHINSFFTNIGPDLAKHHKEPWVYFGLRNQHEMQDFNTDHDEVLKLCKEINVMKSSGIDMLSSRICKDAFVVLTDKLVHLFNCSLDAAIFPSAWKMAKVVPLFKGGDRCDVSNYRPVSLLPIPGKLLEKIVHRRITQFFEDHSFLSSHQGGFRKGHSTLSTIADLTDDLLDQVNAGMTTLAAFIDLKKAFDTVNMNILTKKLDKAGVRGNVLRWCKDYLSGRAQHTVANGTKSKLLKVACGVPQGSVLGPLFFLVYVNDLQYALDDCKLKLYADDTVLYQTGADKGQVERKLQDSLNMFSKWCSANVLTINTKKSKIMAFGSRSRVKKCKKVKIYMGDERLKMVPSYKYLGFNLDPILAYKNHISSVIRSVQFKVTVLGKVKKYLNKVTAVKIYKTMLLPYFDYADVIFDRANTTDLSKLQRLQNRCLRVCLGQERVISTERAHKEAGVPFLSDRRKAHTLNFMYLRKDKRPELLNTREIRTRAHDAPIFNTKVPRCEAFRRSVQYAGSVMWNSLTPQERNIPSYKQFKEVQKRNMLAPLEQIEAN